MENIFRMSEKSKDVLITAPESVHAQRSDQYKNFLPEIASSSPVISEIVWESTSKKNNSYSGIIHCYVPIESLNLKTKDFSRYTGLYDPFVVDFMAELTVRYNLGFFLSEIMSIDSEIYGKAISSMSHAHFGMRLSNTKDHVIFKFHISAVQEILTENIKTQVG